MKTLSILGSTGSIGQSTLDVVRQTNARLKSEGKAPEFKIISLTAFKDYKKLIEQAQEFNPQIAAIVDANAGEHLKAALKESSITVIVGEKAIEEAAMAPSDMTMAAIVGAAGLIPTLAAVDRGSKILLANKECLVSAGPIFLDAAKASGAIILPVDSEHNAIFQVLQDREKVDKLILTASGGPFLNRPLADLSSVTPEEACTHPNWQMGQKISVDCATMMNKGLELIEASLLFSMPQERIDVLIHPQSIVHSMVSYCDGSVLAQLGTPDMRIPISFCLGWPQRLEINAARLNLAQIGKLEFLEPDKSRFRALDLARFALDEGKSAPTILNAANEVAVHTFLNRNVTFTQIAVIVEKTLHEAQKRGLFVNMNGLNEAMAADNEARIIAAQFAQSCAA